MKMLWQRIVARKEVPMFSIAKFSCRTWLIFAGLIVALLALSVLPVQTSKAQEEDLVADSVCRPESDLSLVPGVLSSGGYAQNFDGSFNVVLNLNSNHFLDQVSPYACNKDKFKPISTAFYNVCYYEQYSVGRFTVIPCDCRVNIFFPVKVRFSQNYNINGGVFDPRYKDVSLIIEANPFPAAYCQVF
jgi:hypothetical protein